ncbi:MAG: hypothetical protein HY308_00505 [Gammaproteobacteria bacterium]|nr:hypothetical protein [Gammaproteobacteria bacterium]
MNLLRYASQLPGFLGLWTRFPVGPLKTRVRYGVFPYPQYAYGVYWSAYLASCLGIPRITVAEFGVAGGRGLLACEKISAEVESAVGVGIDVVGFDSGEGMPKAVDYRDLPHIWSEGFYRMDQAKLRARLRRAKLILGDVRETVPQWLASNPAPLGFIAFDLDYYSSTKAAFAIFKGNESSHLPRVHCYFDDVASNDLGCMSQYVGELLAIREFNEAHDDRKISKFELLRLCRTRWEDWQERTYIFHNFTHPQYNTLVIPPDSKRAQLPL